MTERTDVGERLFVAVEIPRAPRMELDAAVVPVRERYPELRWTVADDWHLTLAFLGETPAQRVEPAVEAVGAAASQVGPFALAFDGTAGRFGDRVLWAGIRPAPELIALAAATVEALRVSGFDLERRDFRPHLTLARSRRGARVRAGAVAGFQGPTPEWTVSRVVLMRSSRGGDGPRYQPRAVFGLGRDDVTGDKPGDRGSGA